MNLEVFCTNKLQFILKLKFNYLFIKVNLKEQSVKIEKSVAL